MELSEISFLLYMRKWSIIQHAITKFNVPLPNRGNAANRSKLGP